MDTDKILFYEREFYPFSNFASFQVEYKGEVWPTSEHAYQASKFVIQPEARRAIQEARSAHDAFKLSRKYAAMVREDWDMVKIQVMEDVVRAKLSQHPCIQEKLTETGDKEIVEDSPVDSFWGWGPNKDGENNLGKIWMKLRKELQDGRVAA